MNVYFYGEAKPGIADKKVDGDIVTFNLFQLKFQNYISLTITIV